MGITTTYKCDRCGHEQEEHSDKPRQMWTIEVGIRSKHNHMLSSRQNQLWCRTCVEDVHMLQIPAQGKQREIPPKPSLEELVREIVQEECHG